MATYFSLNICSHLHSSFADFLTIYLSSMHLESNKIVFLKSKNSYIYDTWIIIQVLIKQIINLIIIFLFENNF